MVYNMSCKYIKVQPIGPLHMGCITALKETNLIKTMDSESETGQF